MTVQPLTDEQLTAIRAEAESPHGSVHVRWLLAEVDRLRAQDATVRFAWRRLKTGLIASAHLLDVPFTNAPEQSVWKRLKPSMRELDSYFNPESNAEES